MKKIAIMTVCASLLLGTFSQSAHAGFDYYNSATITKDADNQGNVRYTNKANGKTYTVYADGRTEGDDTYNIKSKEAFKKETVEIGTYKDIRICLPYGQTSISNVKVKKGKGVITAKISEVIREKNVEITLAKEADGSYFYRDRLTGQKINVGTQTEVYGSYADYKVRVYGKKLGKAVLEYQVNDTEGNKVCKKTIKIDVKKNDEAVISATFGGKSLIYDYSKGANNKKYIFYNRSNVRGNETTKKKGRFKVKLSNNYTLKNIYVSRHMGQLYKRPIKDKRYQGWETDRTKMPLDLNGDGDFNDVIDGFEEGKEKVNCYERIRNGQKITLNSDSSYDANDYIDTRDNSRHSYYELYNECLTTFYVVYQDKRNGSYYLWQRGVYLLLSKT